MMTAPARVPRSGPPSLAARRVEVGYVLLELLLVAVLIGLALALLRAPIPERVAAFGALEAGARPASPPPLKLARQTL